MLAIAPNKNAWTNAIVTNVWADGKNRTPCVLYTHNPAFDLKMVQNAPANAKAKAQDQLKALKKALADNSIADFRVVCLEPSKKGSHYCAESPVMYKDFVQRYKGQARAGQTFNANTWVVRDMGTAFSPGGKSVMEEEGITQESVLPPAVHHFFFR
jgi:hypothetical protein